MPGIQLNKALAQFSVYADGVETCGLYLTAFICADALHQGELSSPSGKLYDQVGCHRATIHEPFMVGGWMESRKNKRGTYTSRIEQ